MKHYDMVDLLPAHIRDGVVADCNACPVAQALADRFPDDDIEVYEEFAHIDGNRYDVCDDLRRWIFEFDDWGSDKGGDHDLYDEYPPEPFTLIVDHENRQVSTLADTQDALRKLRRDGRGQPVVRWPRGDHKTPLVAGLAVHPLPNGNPTH